MPELSVRAYFAAWECGCTDVEMTTEAIPARCPEHDTERIRGNDGCDVAELDRPALSGWGVRDSDGNRPGRECGGCSGTGRVGYVNPEPCHDCGGSGSSVRLLG